MKTHTLEEIQMKGLQSSGLQVFQIHHVLDHIVSVSSITISIRYRSHMVAVYRMWVLMEPEPVSAVDCLKIPSLIAKYHLLILPCMMIPLMGTMYIWWYRIGGYT